MLVQHSNATVVDPVTLEFLPPCIKVLEIVQRTVLGSTDRPTMRLEARVVDVDRNSPFFVPVDSMDEAIRVYVEMVLKEIKVDMIYDCPTPDVLLDGFDLKTVMINSAMNRLANQTRRSSGNVFYYNIDQEEKFKQTLESINCPGITYIGTDAIPAGYYILCYEGNTSADGSVIFVENEGLLYFHSTWRNNVLLLKEVQESPPDFKV